MRTRLTRWLPGTRRGAHPERVAAWSGRLGLEPRAILLRDQEKRWASCDAAGQLRFNWRIVQASPQLVDYVVVHELVHLEHPVHGPDFWGALGRALPDYEARRDALRRLGPRLVW